MLGVCDDSSRFICCHHLRRCPFDCRFCLCSVVKVQTSDLLFWVVPLVLFVVATLCAAFVRITNSNLLVSKRNSIGMIVLASFPVGLLTWNVITRAIPVGGMNLASHFEISVIACVLFAASAFAAFAALRFSQKEAEGAGAQIEGGLQPGSSEAWSVIAAEHGLSTRETEVAALTASGETSDSIAVKLQIKAPTVRSYQQRIYRKMGISNREELLALGLAESAVNGKAKNEDWSIPSNFANRMQRKLASSSRLPESCWPSPSLFHLGKYLRGEWDGRCYSAQGSASHSRELHSSPWMQRTCIFGEVPKSLLLLRVLRLYRQCPLLCIRWSYCSGLASGTLADSLQPLSQEACFSPCL